MLNAFDIRGPGLEVGGIFLNISKAYDKCLVQGLIFKLRQNGICGDMINILNVF